MLSKFDKPTNMLIFVPSILHKQTTAKARSKSVG